MPDGSPPTALVEVDALTVEYPGRRRGQLVRAVDDVKFTVAERETVGLVGESGSGKSTIGRAILGLAEVGSGTIRFAGEDITRANGARRRALSNELQVIFQDPYSSLNPTRTIGQTLGETLWVHGVSKMEAAERVASMLELVGLPRRTADRYPAQFSGGQRQRIAIARALVVQPRLVICDEPVSALDLSVQAQVLNLLRDLQQEFQLSYLFIAHDLAVVRYLSHRIIVLYRGQVMEQGAAAAVYEQPAHPYTRALLEAAPLADPELQRARREEAPQHRSDTVAEIAPVGCPFAPRCPHAVDVCVTTVPAIERTSTGSEVACHRWRELGALPQANVDRAAASERR